MNNSERCTCRFTDRIWLQWHDKPPNTHNVCLHPRKTVAFTSGFVENVLSKNKSALWSKCLRTSSATCQSSRSKQDLRPDWLFIPLKLTQSQMSKAAFHWCKTGEWSYGECSNDEHALQLSCQMLKMGSTGHSGSTQGVYAWKVVEAND